MLILFQIVMLPVGARYGEVDVEKERLINDAYLELDIMVNRLRNDKKKLTAVS